MSVHFSSASDDHATPQALFDELNEEFGFTLDVCASDHNTKVDDGYFTVEEDGLTKDWRRYALGGAVWMNPPYGRQIGKWIEKAHFTATSGATVVCLLPARTDTRWFHEFIWDEDAHRPYDRVEIRLLKGRVKFGNAKTGAPFPSMVVIFRAKLTKDS